MWCLLCADDEILDKCLEICLNSIAYKVLRLNCMRFWCLRAYSKKQIKDKLVRTCSDSWLHIYIHTSPLDDLIHNFPFVSNTIRFPRK